VPNYRPDFGVFDPISFETIEEEINKDGKIDAVALTSPTYDGLAADITKIARLCQDRKIKLLIDGAHGSIFPFLKEKFPESGLGV
jgi:arginine decarboxylase